jgi:hypothetical protein
VRNPTYELKIWRAEDYIPAEEEYVPAWFVYAFHAELVYARSGLTEPVHTVETPFAPDTLYLWTIRARFELNGEPRVTEWGGRRFPSAKIPPLGYYMFKTPRQ